MWKFSSSDDVIWFCFVLLFFFLLIASVFLEWKNQSIERITNDIFASLHTHTRTHHNQCDNRFNQIGRKSRPIIIFSLNLSSVVSGKIGNQCFGLTLFPKKKLFISFDFAVVWCLPLALSLGLSCAFEFNFLSIFSLDYDFSVLFHNVLTSIMGKKWEASAIMKWEWEPQTLFFLLLLLLFCYKCKWKKNWSYFQIRSEMNKYGHYYGSMIEWILNTENNLNTSAAAVAAAAVVAKRLTRIRKWMDLNKLKRWNFFSFLPWSRTTSFMYFFFSPRQWNFDLWSIWFKVEQTISPEKKRKIRKNNHPTGISSPDTPHKMW